ncbi:MAG: lipid II flippase MurJ [Anaerolineales bacterium]|jgi:putative peptidoglycan lipid II flippase|nr:lipid II flippase MurJ [Anaerolineales bacterium]
MISSIITRLKLTRTSLNALLVIALFGFDKILAFVRTGIISRQYREEVHLLDTFNAANNLPDLLFALISGGALAMAFIPLLTEYLTKKDRAAAWDLFSRVANLAFVVTGAIAILIAIFAEQIAARVIAPGFPPDQLALLADLMRLNLIATVIFSISGLVMASLQANQHFLMPGLAPAAYNVGQILGAIFLVPLFGIKGLVYGVILGASLHLLIQVPALAAYGFRWTASLDLSNTGLNEALGLLWPRLLTMGGIQIVAILRDNFASQLQQPGAVTALTYGWMIMQVPQTILGTAIATAMLPALSELAARQDWTEFGQAVERALRVLIAATLPLAVIMAAGLHPLVRAVFGFGEEISLLITWTARAFLLTLLGYNIHELAVRSFYARKQPFMPLFAVLLRLVLFSGIGLAAITFFRSVGAPLIALAEISLLVEAVLLFFLLSREIQQPLRVGKPFALSLLASAVGGALAYLIAVYLPGGAISTALIGMVVGGLAALVIVWPEVKMLFRL